MVQMFVCCIYDNINLFLGHVPTAYLNGSAVISFDFSNQLAFNFIEKRI